MNIKNYKCPKCKTTSSCGAWNAATLAHCTKEKKVPFLVKIQNGGNAPKLSYICPACQEVSTKNTIVPVPPSQIPAPCCGLDQEELRGEYPNA